MGFYTHRKVFRNKGNQKVLNKIEEVFLNPENGLENLFRVEPASNQRLRRLFFCIRSAAMNLE
jgi:hypothetical protein